MRDTTPYIVPKEPGRWRALTFAACVHAALLAFLWIGVRWQNDTPVAIEAEVWSPQTREAAPQPEPVKEPEKKTVIKETKETSKPSVTEPRIAKPDIALEQEKKRKEQEEKKRREEEKLAKLKEQTEKQRLEKEKEKEKEKAENARRIAAEKKRKQDEADAQLLAKARDEEMKRITGGVTGTGGTGDAPKAQGARADASYAQRVAAKIKSNINFNVLDEGAGNPAVEYAVDLLPDGSVAGMRKTKSSGISGFDEAVRRAIEKSQPYPKDKSGTVPSSFIGVHKLKDQ